MLRNKMSTINEQRREKQEETKTITSVNAIRKTDEAGKDSPSYTQMIDEYKKQTFQQRRF
jgi:hypothetical protein